MAADEESSVTGSEAKKCRKRQTQIMEISGTENIETWEESKKNHCIRGVVPWIVLMPLFSWLGTEHVLFHRFSNIDRLSERLEFEVISKS